MKVSKTLLFMFRNPIPFIVQLVCWFLYAALQVISKTPFTDESLSGEVSFIDGVLPGEVSFIDGALPGIVRLTKTSFDNLPGSLENFAIIVSIIFDEVIIEVMRDGSWVFILIPVFIISYREAKGNLKGISKERQTWMQWYDRQQEIIKQEDSLEQPPSTLEDTQANSYFRKTQKTALSMVRNPMFLVLHFACWFTPLILLFIIDWASSIETARNFLNFLPIAFTFAAIPALISSYQETRGTVKGTAKEGEVWTKWYQRQINATAQGYTLAGPPPSLKTT